MELAIWLIVGLIVGGAIGAVATWWISRARGGVVSVMQLKQENDKFRDEVAEHFVETARLINQMSESYKQVFDHLSNGAEKLVDDEKLAERLPPATGQEVRLSQFGASASADSVAEKSGKSGSGAAANDIKPDSRSNGRSDGNSNDNTSGQSEEETGKDATKDGDKTSSGKDPLKGGSSQTGAKTSRPAAADSKGDSERGNDGKSASGGTGESLKADDTKEKSADSAGKGGSASNQAGDDSRTKD